MPRIEDKQGTIHLTGAAVAAPTGDKTLNFTLNSNGLALIRRTVMWALSNNVKVEIQLNQDKPNRLTLLD